MFGNSTLRRFFSTQLSFAISYSDIKFLSPLAHSDPLAGRHGMSDFGSVLLVHHHKALEFPNIMDQDFLEARLQDMATTLISTVANAWHRSVTSHAPPHRVINTPGLPP